MDLSKNISFLFISISYVFLHSHIFQIFILLFSSYIQDHSVLYMRLLLSSYEIGIKQLIMTCYSYSGSFCAFKPFFFIHKAIIQTFFIWFITFILFTD